MIAIQSILLQWTKETRGEPYASPRSRHPRSYALPVLPSRRTEAEASRTESGGMLLQRLAFRQTTDGFRPLQSEQEVLPLPEPGSPVDGRLMAGVLPELRDGRLSVRLRYVPEFGKPVRTDGRSVLLEKLVFELAAGEYGRIRINGRHVEEAGHRYELRTINIAFADDIAANVFTRREPDRRCDWLEPLW
ncbi:hypothetical protein [Saccharibacillus alkalitolerans]|uniref:Uncharacterized protein n=1 Tax=Saccharibacillus alkalitolerans TaxID=2705290 RepID=A0ABX0F4P4_9BACL|nr:hypothetical protein [Saccharibacillus alkalitolerans]NGZ75662.1 hypothetical protein [Saccharibacillus alkalitolerans]